MVKKLTSALQIAHTCQHTATLRLEELRIGESKLTICGVWWSSGFLDATARFHDDRLGGKELRLFRAQPLARCMHLTENLTFTPSSPRRKNLVIPDKRAITVPAELL